MKTFEQLSQQEYAEQLNYALMACNQIPIHDNPCYVQLTFAQPAAPVPEPATMVLMIVGIMVLFVWRRYAGKNR